MKQVQSDLWETEVESPVPGLTTRAYLLTRHAGNLLFYNTSHGHEIENMAKLGGVAYQFLSHQDELGASLNVIRSRFGAKLGGSVHEQAEFAKIRVPDITFDKREKLLGCIEVIPTPGHTPGSTCFLVESDSGKRYLFTGDTIYFSKAKEWKAGFIPGISDLDALTESLGILQELEPDFVLSSGSDGGGGYQEMAPGDWFLHVNHARSRLYKRHADEQGRRNNEHTED